MRYPLLVLVLVAGCISSETGESEQSSDLEAAAAAIPACPTGTWCVETAPVTGTLLHAIWAVSANDVFAVGDGGTILRRQNGNAWTQMVSGTTANLRGLWAASSSDVWAGGVGGVILHFNGTAWSSVTGATTDVDAVWGSGSNDVWFCGSGTVLRRANNAFTKFTFAGTLLAVSGTGPNDVWVTGENTNTHHWNGSTWTTVNPGAGTSTLLTVLARATNDVWVADFMPNKETLRFNGSKWVAQKTSGSLFNSMSALSASDIWGAGGNDVGHWDGTAWTSTQAFGSNAAMWSVTTVPGHAWLVGSSALIAHRPL
jgi:hypothetical protein